MKKFKLSFMMILICALTFCCVLFTGCSSTGTYKFDSLKVDDGNTSTKIEIGEKYEGIEFEKDSIILILNDDNTYVLRYSFTMEYGDEEETMTEVQIGTWTEGYEDEIYLKKSDSSSVMIIEKDGNKITIGNDDYTLTLKS